MLCETKQEQDGFCDFNLNLSFIFLQAYKLFQGNTLKNNVSIWVFRMRVKLVVQNLSPSLTFNRLSWFG